MMIRKRKLLLTPATGELANTISLTSAIDGKPIKPLSRKAFLKLGTARKMVLLTRRETQPEEGPVETAEETMETDTAESHSVTAENLPEQDYQDRMVDEERSAGGSSRPRPWYCL